MVVEMCSNAAKPTECGLKTMRLRADVRRLIHGSDWQLASSTVAGHLQQSTPLGIGT
jgi:hypothetical protein